MEVDGCDEEDLSIHSKIKKPEFFSDEEDEDDGTEDQVLWEKNVVVCTSAPNTEMFCVSYPSSKRDAWDGKRFPMARYKKNVRFLEMRFLTDTSTGSYDKKKAELMLYEGGESKKAGASAAPGIEALRANDEVYEGRAFVHDHPIVNAIGFMKNGEFFIHPLTGSFEMHRSIRALNRKKKLGKGGNSEDESTEDDEEVDPRKAATSGAVRVKFSRPETERQKKRREASALHREKQIASDLWIPMKVHLKEDEPVNVKKAIISTGSTVKGEESGVTEVGPPPEMNIRELVNRAIICGMKEELVIESGKEHMLSKQRIDELSSPELQLKAHMVKSHVMKTSEMRRLIDSRAMSTDLMIEQLKQCSRLVNGVWVLDSNLMFQNLPPAHSNTAGKTDLYRAELWRNARDLALSLIDGGHRVTRLSLMTCFQLNERDADEILSTFGVRCEKTRSWKLRIERDDEFLKDPAMKKHVIAEKVKWINTFNELEKSFHAPPPKPSTKKK
ncbi:hypothetical protein CRE_25730 [Caenorhabditis remanei]|uniref:DNA-directed RNA polymerase III subunit RPC5 n=1 Tax=Caenorhabditis remanei TaxID=31234 RepID=E3MLB8_CAERE|nr:hypothetical protein CRE_25730 [Caenorhabditis remanei]